MKGFGRREGKEFSSGNEYQEGLGLHLQAHEMNDGAGGEKSTTLEA